MKIDASGIARAVMNHVAETGKYPVSVRKFCRDLEITDAEFFKHFPSFDQAESAFWAGMVDDVTEALEAGGDWGEAGAKARLLAWHFAFIEVAQAERSLVLQRFGKASLVNTPEYLRGFSARFGEFAERVVERGLETGEIADRGPLVGAIKPVLVFHLRTVIGFFLRDASDEFEDTDAMIEKSVAVAFDLFAKQAVDSGADLVKFLLGRRWGRCGG